MGCCRGCCMSRYQSVTIVICSQTRERCALRPISSILSITSTAVPSGPPMTSSHPSRQAGKPAEAWPTRHLARPTSRAPQRVWTYPQMFVPCTWWAFDQRIPISATVCLEFQNGPFSPLSTIGRPAVLECLDKVWRILSKFRANQK